MATWTTYGTWLQGSKKGYVKNGITLKANPELEESNKALLKHDKITIPKNIRMIIKNAILKEAEEIGQKVFALAVCSNHVHIVVESIGKRCGYSVGRFKKAATRPTAWTGSNPTSSGLENTVLMIRCGRKDLIRDIVIVSRNWKRKSDTSSDMKIKILALCIAEGFYFTVNK
jgi:hypothetical protein